MIDNRNMLLAVVLSILILLGFELYFPKQRPAPPPEAPKTAEQATKPPSAPPAPGTVPTPAPAPTIAPVPSPAIGAVPSAPSGPPTAAGTGTRQAVLAQAPRIRIASPHLHGSISLIGGRLDDLTLADYRERPDFKSPEIVLLSPRGLKDAYYAQFGWVGPEGVPLPGQDTVWTADSTTLTAGGKVILTWDNGKGLRFYKTIALDENYMFSVTQRVMNTTKEPVTLYPYGFVSRTGTPQVAGFYILHEGPLGVFDNTLKEVKYDDLKKKNSEEQRSSGGWIGITDKYWLTALVPNQKGQITTRFIYSKDGGEDRYQVDYLNGGVTIPPGGSGETEGRLFAGAKVLGLLDSYQSKYNIPRFDLAIDFGWFYFLTKPIFYALVWLHKHVGNFGIAILLLTVAIKLLFFPLANKSYVAMSKMKKLQPEMVKLRERFGNDKARLNQELMALYKREKANPASGCLPILIQIPVFFALYKVLYVTIEMRHAPFYGWIKDLSAPDPTTIFNLFGLIPWTPPEFLHVGVWPLIMGVTMWLQQKLNPQPADPVQAKMFMLLPWVFTFMLASFPAGLVIYWAWNNVLSMLQQWVIMKRMGVPAT
jgi:YidC/Oxa1 family membrane protein insertase